MSDQLLTVGFGGFQPLTAFRFRANNVGTFPEGFDVNQIVDWNITDILTDTQLAESGGIVTIPPNLAGAWHLFFRGGMDGGNRTVYRYTIRRNGNILSDSANFYPNDNNFISSENHAMDMSWVGVLNAGDQISVHLSHVELFFINSNILDGTLSNEFGGIFLGQP